MTVKWAAILGALVIAFVAGYHQGGLAPKLAAAKTELKQEAAQDAKRLTDTKTIAEEAKTYEAAIDPLAPLPAPVVRLCYNSTTPALPSAHPAGSGGYETAAIRAPDPAAAVPGPDIGRPLVQVSHNADAQVAAMQDYINHVCQAHAP